MERPIRYAVIGLGHIAQVAVLPAFKKAKNSKLVALITDDSVKLQKLGRQYKIKNLYNYKQFDACMQSGEIDALYISLPNTLHREYTERAARYGVHVLCEKPIAPTSEDALAMIAAAEKQQIKLMIAYRLHFEKANLKASEIARAGQLGDLRLFHSTFTMQINDKKNIRLQKKLAGGTLYDIGIYCINACRSIFREEPIEVFATQVKNTDARFKEVDEMTSAILRFPNEKIATFSCSFGADSLGYYEVIGTKGSLLVDSAYSYQIEVKHTLRINNKIKKQKFAHRDQFAPELIYFSDCIQKNKHPEPSGLEGLMDVRIIEALLESARSEKFVKIPSLQKNVRHPTSAQEKFVPAHKDPPLTHVKSPHG